jgi:alkylhydroperoxidase family enzyme
MGETAVDAALADWRTAPLDEKVRAALGFLERVTLAPESVDKDDLAPLRALGVSKQAAEDALLVCFCFNLIDRLADSFGWEMQDAVGVAASTKLLIGKGYKLPFHRVAEE